MDVQLAQRIARVKPSATLAVTARAKALQAQGRDVISLGAGEPDFDTPEHIKAAARKAIDAGFTKYTAVEGTAELRRAIVDKFKRENALDYTPDQVLVSVGGKQSFYNLAQALLDTDDEVVIPAPYWVSYPDMVLLAGGAPVIVRAGIDQGYKITAAQLEGALSPRTKLVVINSPSNPTGVVYTRDELAELGAVLANHPRVWVATDDMYEHVRWDGAPFVNIVNACPELYERTIVLNGVSKAYSMTGWRIGYAAGNAKLIAAMAKVQSQSTSNPCSISQVAAQAALEGDQGFIGEMVSAFKERHDYVLGALNAIPGFRCIASQGAFYAFFSVKEAMDRVPGMKNDVQFAEHLLETTGVALVPGSAFGVPGYMRLSFATDMGTLRAAMQRLADGLASA